MERMSSLAAIKAQREPGLAIGRDGIRTELDAKRGKLLDGPIEPDVAKALPGADADHYVGFDQRQ